MRHFLVGYIGISATLCYRSPLYSCRSTKTLISMRHFVRHLLQITFVFVWQFLKVSFIFMWHFVVGCICVALSYGLPLYSSSTFLQITFVLVRHFMIGYLCCRLSPLLLVSTVFSLHPYIFSCQYCPPTPLLLVSTVFCLGPVYSLLLVLSTVSSLISTHCIFSGSSVFSPVNVEIMHSN